MKFIAPKILCVGLLALLACGRTELDNPFGDSGSVTGSGGRPDAGSDAAAGRAGTGGSGGRPGTGGVPATGGSVGTGGRSGSGGAVGTGGRSGTGGRVGTGGSGGRTGTGGTIDAGPPDAGPPDAGTGGRGGTGGVVGTGGRVGTGGAIDGGTRDAGTGGAARDAGPDLPPSNPGVVACGAMTCDSKTQSCCVSLAGGAVATCVPTGTACAGTSLVCDEPGDCASGVCCFGFQAGGAGLSIGSRCTSRASCGGFGRFVVCRKDADCGAAAPLCCISALSGVPVCQATCPGR